MVYEDGALTCSFRKKALRAMRMPQARTYFEDLLSNFVSRLRRVYGDCLVAVSGAAPCCDGFVEAMGGAGMNCIKRS